MHAAIRPSGLSGFELSVCSWPVLKPDAALQLLPTKTVRGSAGAATGLVRSLDRSP